MSWFRDWTIAGLWLLAYLLVWTIVVVTIWTLAKAIVAGVSKKRAKGDVLKSSRFE